MGLDAICLRAVLAELSGKLIGGRIEKIYQPTRDDVILQMHIPDGHVKLLLSAAPGRARAQLTEVERENPEKPPMFCMLLRKHLSGGKLTDIIQPYGDRVAEFVFESTSELGERRQRSLILECMGSRTNLILLDEDRRIIDCLRRVEGDIVSGKRAVMPGLFYEPVTANPRLSPLISREAEEIGAPADWGEQLWKMAESGQSTPTMLVRDGKPVDFSFMAITQYGPDTKLRIYDTYGELMDDFYVIRDRDERVRQQGQDLIRAVKNARERTERKLVKQRLNYEKSLDRDQLRRYGDLITSNMHLVQKGMSSIRVQDFYDPEGNEVEIPLDPLLKPQENAAKYYREYSKAKTAEKVLTEQLKAGEEDLNYLESVQDALSKAEGERDLQEIREELRETGFLRDTGRGKKKAKTSPAKCMEFQSSSGLRISVGKNNTQNDRLTTRQAGKDDIWLHTQKIHGSHVILWCDGKEPDDVSLSEAAALAAWFSQGRESGKVAVDYTPVKNVKKPSGAKPGMVIYNTCNTVNVVPDPEIPKKLRLK